MKAQRTVIAVLAVVVCTSLACLAADEKTGTKQYEGKQTVQIQADNIAYNAQTKELTASGSVVITMKDGSTIKTDKVVAKTDEKGTLGCATSKVAQTQPSSSDGLKVVAMIESGNDLQVGLVDTGTTPPKQYLLRGGEKQDGVEVVQADYKKESVLVRKNGQECCLTLGVTATTLLDSPVASALTNAPVSTNGLLAAVQKGLEIIDLAKEQWAMANQKFKGDLPTTNDLLPWIKGGQLPKPTVGRYVINPMGTSPEFVLSLWELEEHHLWELRERYEAEQRAAPLPAAPQTGPSEGAH